MIFSRVAAVPYVVVDQRRGPQMGRGRSQHESTRAEAGRVKRRPGISFLSFL
jgi:hypothetical protein